MARLNKNIHELLNENILDILFTKKIYTIIDYLESDAKSLAKFTNLNFKQILEIRKKILQEYSAPSVTGLSLFDNYLKNANLTPTFIQNLDNLIDGGLHPGFIYEFFGASAVGKTQICFTIAINIAQYIKEDVYFIDTKRDFSAKRLKNMLIARNCTEEDISDILSRIKVKRITDRFELLNDLYEIKNKYIEETKCPVIIIDSLPSLFYTMGEFNTVLSIMNHFVNILRFICVKLNTSAIVTNILLPKFTNKDGFDVTKSRPGLGKYWENIPHARILLKKELKSSECKSIVEKSTYLKCGEECILSITEIGVV